MTPVLALLVVLAAPPPDPGWVDLAAMGVLGGASLALALTPIEGTPGWERRNRFDEKVRTGFAAQPGGRNAAAWSSHIGLGVVVAYPSVVALIERPEHAVGTTTVQLEALLATTLVAQVTKHASRRERPRVRHTSETQTSPNASFPSGHAASAFSAATTGCFLQRHAWLCGGGYALATGVAALRLVADEHYATDVVAGAAVGTAVGALTAWIQDRW